MCRPINTIVYNVDKPCLSYFSHIFLFIICFIHGLITVCWYSLSKSWSSPCAAVALTAPKPWRTDYIKGQKCTGLSRLSNQDILIPWLMEWEPLTQYFSPLQTISISIPTHHTPNCIAVLRTVNYRKLTIQTSTYSSCQSHKSPSRMLTFYLGSNDY